MTRPVVLLANQDVRLLEIALAGFSPQRVKMHSRSKLDSARFFRPRNVLRYGVPTATLIAELKRLNPCVVVLFEREDTRNILPTLFRELEHTRFVSIQTARHFESAHLHLWWPRDRRRLKILTWGEFLINQAVIQGRDSRGRYPVGSLEASLFSEFFGEGIKEPEERQICIIVKRKSLESGSSLLQANRERTRNTETLLKFASAFCRDHGMTAVIPIDTRKSEAELANDIEWCESLKVAPEVYFSDSVPRFVAKRPDWYPSDHRLPEVATFRTLAIAANSALTIGTQNSAVIWQSLGLGYPTLSIGFGDYKYFEFPMAGIWRLQNPSFEEFSLRVSQLLRLPNHRFSSDELKPIRFLVDLSNPESVVKYLRDLVKSATQEDSWDY